MTKLVCPDCQHENEPERIYCHNCGGRLDRSMVKQEKLAASESPAGTQARLKEMFDPARGRKKAIAATFGKVVLSAFLAALVLELLLPPNLPPEVKSQSLTPMISMDLLSAIESRQPAQFVYSQDQVNQYLASVIRRPNSPATQGYFPIRRVLVQFDEGLCRVNTIYNFFGLTLSDGGFYRVGIEQGKIVATCEGGRVGRMPVHPLLMRRLGLLMAKTWSTLDREEKQVSRLARIEFHPQSATLTVMR